MPAFGPASAILLTGPDGSGRLPSAATESLGAIQPPFRRWVP